MGSSGMKEFDIEDLREYDGQEGRPVYIAYKGKVFDVSGSDRWRGGLHMRRHHAGQDLTTDLKAAPHGEEALERYPQIGLVKPKVSPEPKLPEPFSSLLKKYPMLRRHPHPMTVHFPLVFMLSTTAFSTLYLITSVQSFDTTALHCLGAGILFFPIVMLTGMVSWWLNYLAKPLQAIKIKLITSLALFVVAIMAFTWRITVPDILHPFRMASFFYFLVVSSLTPLVSIVGWFGAKLTFPVEGE
jgi:predicted heme/steroid binding protein/uncharacterized membrane protein